MSSQRRIGIPRARNEKRNAFFWFVLLVRVAAGREASRSFRIETRGEKIDRLWTAEALAMVAITQSLPVCQLPFRWRFESGFKMEIRPRRTESPYG
jgi:hypothetical protein